MPLYINDDRCHSQEEKSTVTRIVLGSVSNAKSQTQNRSRVLSHVSRMKHFYENN